MSSANELIGGDLLDNLLEFNMVSFANDTQTANQQAGISLGMAVSLNAVRNSTSPMPPGYQKLIGELKEQFAALDQIQRKKRIGALPARGPVPVYNNGGQDFRIPPVPKQLRDLIAKQQAARLAAALEAWSQRAPTDKSI